MTLVGYNWACSSEEDSHRNSEKNGERNSEPNKERNSK